MTKDQEKQFFMYWLPCWTIDQLKKAYIALVQKGHHDLDTLFIQTLESHNIELLFTENYQLAIIHYQQKRYNMYMVFLKQAWKQEPQNLEINFRITQYYMEQGMYLELNQLVKHMETFIPNHHQVLFLKGLCILKLINNTPVTRELWTYACMEGSTLACEGLKELNELEMIIDIEQKLKYQQLLQEREQSIKNELTTSVSTYSSNDFMKEFGGTAARAAMFSIIGGVVTSMLFGGGGSA